MNPLTTPTSPPSAEHHLDLLQRYFLNRPDLVVVRASWGKPCPATTVDLDGLLRTHLLGLQAPAVPIQYQFRGQARDETGHYRVGAYTPGPDNRTRWLCLDFDAGNDEKSHPLADATAAVLRVLDICQQLGLLAYLERSGGGQGWHLWLFFDPPLPAHEARRLGLRLLPRDFLLANGAVADPLCNLGVEVFPKKTRLNGGPGTMVWLPWWSGAATGGNQFYTAPFASTP